MEASERSEPAPEEPAPEILPAEVKEKAPTPKKMIAVIVAVVVIIAAVAGAWGLGLFGAAENKPPVDGAKALTDTTIDIGGSVTFESLGSDPDGEIVEYAWYFGDGTEVVGDEDTAKTVTHTYEYGGDYWVYHVVTDNDNATADNEDSMIKVNVTLYEPVQPEDEWDNDTAPYAGLAADMDIIQINTTVTFFAAGYGAEWHWINESNHSEGAIWLTSWEYVTSMVIDFGDGSATQSLTPAEVVEVTHKYTTRGHYAAKLTVTSSNDLSTTVMKTIHILKPEATAPGAIKNPDAFVMLTIGEPDYLDPAINYETAGGEVLQNVYETLVWYDRDSVVDLIPLLATEIPTIANGLVSPDGMNYTFNLRTGVTFHDGTAMTADDVVYSIQRVLRIHDPDGPSWMLEQVMTDYLSYQIGDELQNFTTDAQWLLDALGGSDPDYVITEADVQAVAEAAVIKVNDTAVRFRLTHPYPGFIQIAAYTVMNIVSKDFVEAHGGIVNGEHNDYMIQHTCGTGPYKLVEWDVGSKVHMTRNDDYWGTKPAIKDVFIVKANDVNTRILKLKGGDADSIYLPIEYESLFAGKAEYRIVKGLPTFDMMFIGFNFEINTTEAAKFGSNVPTDFFTDKNVRLAFAHLFNYQLFLTNIMKGNAIQPNGAIPEGMFGYNASIPKYTYDLKKAQWALENATNAGTGNSWWDDGFTIAFFYNAGNLYREAACQYMKASLEQLDPVGGKFKATINPLDWSTYLSQLRRSPSPFPMFWLGWAPDYPDPDNYMTPFLDSDYGVFPYRTSYSNDTINSLIRAAAAELDEDARYDLYSEASMLVYEDVPYVWLYQAKNFHIERSWIQGYYFNPMYSGYYYAAFSK